MWRPRQSPQMRPAMTTDGYVRMIGDKAARMQRREESLARMTPDAARMEFVPTVDVRRGIVMLRCGSRWLTYGMRQEGRIVKPAYVPAQSHPVEFVDPQSAALMGAALDAWINATQRPEDVMQEWDYRGMLGRELSDEDAATLAALQALDPGGRGRVVTSRREVAEVRARLAAAV